MEIHIARDGEQFGPFPPDEVRRQLAVGTLLPTDLAWAEGAIDWVPLGSLAMLAPTPESPALPTRLPRLSGRFVPVRATQGLAAGPRVSGAAVASLICGVLSLSVLPIILTGGAVTGEGMATAGLVTGYFGIGIVLLTAIAVAFAVFFAGTALPYFSDMQSRGSEMKAVVNAKLIATTCHLYAADHHGVFPRTLDELVPKYLPDRSNFVCPLSPQLPMGYEYYGGTMTDPPDKVLLMSKFVDSHGKRVLAHVDGSCLFQVPPQP
jgi:hypothetical protein